MPAFVISNHRSCTVTPRNVGLVSHSRSLASLQKTQNDQIKKTKSHVALLFLPEGVGSNETKGDLFTMSKYPAVDRFRSQHSQTLLFSHTSLSTSAIIEPKQAKKIGGARRDRTDDILLAKQALSQLSYGPIFCFDRPFLPTTGSGWPGWTRTTDLTLIRRAL